MKNRSVSRFPSCAENGKQALTLMRELSPSIVFVDMSMPVMDGVEFLKHATQECGRCAFIVISGYDDFRYAQQAIHFHVSDYLLKPVVADELNQAIEHAMKTLFPDEDFSAEGSVSSLTAQQVVTLLHDTTFSRMNTCQDCSNPPITLESPNISHPSGWSGLQVC